ncbi:MAG TPA: RDD family protein [Methylophilaceae bacterium]|nr:RDD family protein [Methylophilaceae bacterium]
MDSPHLLRRLASLLYDGLLLVAILFVATFLFIALCGDATHGVLRYVLQAYLYAVAACYFLWCWLHGGQTLAMQTWRIRLTNIEGLAISPAQAVKRYLLASVGLLFFGAGFIWAVFDRQGLFLHDRLLGTRLINAPRKI